MKSPKLWGAPWAVKRRRFAFRNTACYPPAAEMRLSLILVIPLLGVALTACGTSISGINARPDKYYQHKVKFTGRIERIQYLPHETLLEVADTHGGRIFVRCAEPVDAETGQWVRVEGVLVPEARVEDVVVYDVVSAEEIKRTRAPRFRNLM